MNEFDGFMIGDQVSYKGPGGGKDCRSCVWEIIKIERTDYFGVIATVRLIKGKIDNSANHKYGPGYIHNYPLKRLKKVEA